MEELDNTSYAPQSPDLSGAAASAAAFAPHPQHREYRGSVSYASPFTPTESSPPFTFPPVPARGNYPPQPSHLAYGQPPYQDHLPAHSHSHERSYSLHSHPHAPPQPQTPGAQQNYFGSSALQSQQPLQPLTYPYDSTPLYGAPSPRYTSIVKKEDPDGYYSPTDPSMADASRSKRVKKEDVEGNDNDAPGVREGIRVSTKFPVARIKRIMQADEDVGKVAQVTPVVVSKALELFMISLVTKASTVAKSRGSKRVLASHLKHVIESDPQFDYLQEIVGKIAEAPAAGAGGKGGEPDSEDEGSAVPSAVSTGAKKRKARRRRGDDAD